MHIKQQIVELMRQGFHAAGCGELTIVQRTVEAVRALLGAARVLAAGELP